jgi:hypothetical protein
LLVNIPVLILDKLLSFPEAHFPQTEMLMRAYAKIEKAHRLDCVQGTFGPKPDGNFERLLRVTAKILGSVSEDDRYYRAQLGLTFLLAHQEVRDLKLSPEELKDLCRTQWLFDVSFLPSSYVVANRAEFVEIALCDYLGNLTRLDLPLGTGSEIGGLKS